jgi:ABC-type transport system involved in multi-copper enzyme maturation permease subunit
MYATRHIRRRSVIIVILLANIPTIVGAVLLYLIGQGKQIGPLSGSLPAINLRMARPFVDNFLTATAILGAIVGPPTIAGGRRAGAVVFHLIRPMTARQFVIGHWVAVSSVLCTVGLLPMTVLFLFARLVIPAEVVGTLPWIGVVRVMLFGVVTAAIVGLMVVAVSAVAGSSRGAFLLWLLAYFGSKLAMDVVRTAKMGDVARCISLPDMLKQLATYVLEGGSRFEGCGPWWMLVGGVVVAVSVFILSRGVSAVERT